MSLPVPAPSSSTVAASWPTSHGGRLAGVRRPGPVVGVDDAAEGVRPVGCRLVVHQRQATRGCRRSSPAAIACETAPTREDWRCDRSARAAAAPGGRAVGVRGGPRRHRRAAARPRAAAYVAETDRRGAAGRRPRVRGPGGLDVDAGRGPGRGGRRPGGGRGPGLGAPALAGADAAALTAPSLARLHALASGGRRVGPAARRRVAVPAPGLGRMLAETSAPALLVAAVVHADLAAAAPFPSHNGIVARAAERLVWVARGVDERSVLVPEAGPPRAPGGVRVEPARLPRRRHRPACTPGCGTPPRPRRGAEASPLPSAQALSASALHDDGRALRAKRGGRSRVIALRQASSARP